MTRTVIPDWNANGIIPPLSAAGPTSAERSPYTVSLCDLILRYATSQKRVQILNGFLKYRSRLHAAGLIVGFQWLDGSFHENVEVIEARDPNDIDVVTFYDLPVGFNQLQAALLFPDVFPRTAAERLALKATLFVDAFIVSLGLPRPVLVQRSSYWYSMWSHRRDATWKGYLQIDLDPAEDPLAALQLRAPATPGGSP
jgi:hypothetical protein